MTFNKKKRMTIHMNYDTLLDVVLIYIYTFIYLFFLIMIIKENNGVVKSCGTFLGSISF